MVSMKKELPEGTSIEAICAGRCGVETDHAVLALVEERNSDDNFDWWGSYRIIQCLGCKTVSFREGSQHSEDWDFDDDGHQVLNETVTLYPPRTADSKGLGSDKHYLPSMLSDIYDETRDALVNSQPVLAGIGLRAIVETLCNDKNVPGPNLAKKIDALATQGLLTAQHCAILHKIRTLGNAAAHEVKPHPPKQLALAMNVVEHLLESVYIMPAKVAQEFPDPPAAIPTRPAIAALPAMPPAVLPLPPSLPAAPAAT